MTWRAMRSLGLAVTALMVGGVLLSKGVTAQPTAPNRVFASPMDRVWTVTRSTLKGLGWDIDKEDREGGWIRTDSRRLEGEDYGVYAKGTRQRLRLVLKALDKDRTMVTVERRVWTQERILWMDKEKDLPSPDRKAESQILDAIAAAL